VICREGTSYVLEADVTAYFDSIVRDQLMEMVEKRVRDGSILRLIGKWMNAGVIEEGRLLTTETGTGQGQVISPLLANIYLHYVLDVWFDKEVQPRLRGRAHLIRYLDDFVICFQYEADAKRVSEVLPKRFGRYGLELHPDKTRLIAFGRRALEAAEKGGKKPATFDFLGFTHICAWSQKGRFTIHVRTIGKRLRRSLLRISEWCRKHRHDPVDEQREALNRKLLGHYQYYGRPTNYPGIWRFYRAVRRIWRKWLNRRTRGKTLPWPEYAKLLTRHPLVLPRITRPWANSGSHA
jgi:group II intron reverse transcriptase/maturase